MAPPRKATQAAIDKDEQDADRVAIQLRRSAFVALTLSSCHGAPVPTTVAIEPSVSSATTAQRAPVASASPTERRERAPTPLKLFSPSKTFESTNNLTEEEAKFVAAQNQLIKNLYTSLNEILSLMPAGCDLSQPACQADWHEHMARYNKLSTEIGRFRPLCGWFPTPPLPVYEWLNESLNELAKNPKELAKIGEERFAAYSEQNLFELRRQYSVELRPCLSCIAPSAPKVHATVNFESYSTIVRAEAAPILDEIASLLRAHPDWKLLVQGHIDASETGQAQLGQNRANQVVAELTKRQVPKSQLKSIDRGGTMPVEKSNSPTAKQKNQRVDFALLGSFLPIRFFNDAR